MNFTKLLPLILVLVFSISVSSQSLQKCNSTTVSTSDIDLSSEADGVRLKGVYCANSGGYAITEKEVTANNKNIRFEVGLTSPSSDEFVTQALTKVNFTMFEQVKEGEYNVTYDISVDDSIVNSGEKTIEVKENRGILAVISNWLRNLI
jgi:putative salt-induced outer membrane protein YdiY